MKRKQTYNPLIDVATSDLVAPNRRTYRQLIAQGMKPEEVKRVGAQPFQRAEPKRLHSLTQEMREFLARENGSKTGKLKKKHIWRQREEDGFYEDIENALQLGRDLAEGNINLGDLNNE